MTEDLGFNRSAVAPGTPDAFHILSAPYQRELLVHCYRILGSLDDAEDALQEAMLRGWQRFDTLKEPSSLRAWLYKIATNVSLDSISRRKQRALPETLSPAADPARPLPLPVDEPVWLEPLPDEYLAAQTPGPETQAELREGVSLAFLALLQQLPGRQRAALILCDVLGWPAQETAEALSMSVAAVNSSLQRARAALKKSQGAADFPPRLGDQDAEIAGLLQRYMRAWESADALELASLLRQDATLTMPPLPSWYQGRAAIRLFFEINLFGGPEAIGRFKVLATHANASPAVAVYQRSPAGAYEPASLQVLTISSGQVARVDCFLVSGKRVFARFGLPPVLDSSPGR
jgi:RNA polymerase sigma-70 factor (ECF subfamily)